METLRSGPMRRVCRWPVAAPVPSKERHSPGGDTLSGPFAGPPHADTSRKASSASGRPRRHGAGSVPRCGFLASIRFILLRSVTLQPRAPIPVKVNNFFNIQ